MTVEELIEQLSKLPPKTKVYKEYYREDDSCCGGQYIKDLIEDVKLNEFFKDNKRKKLIQTVTIS